MPSLPRRLASGEWPSILDGDMGEHLVRCQVSLRERELEAVDGARGRRIGKQVATGLERLAQPRRFARNRLGANLKPSIQVLIQCLLRRVPAVIPLAEQFVEMSLSVPQSAVDGLVQVLSLLVLRIAAVVHARQPGVAGRVQRSGRLFVP